MIKLKDILNERYTFEHDPTDSRFHKEIEHFLAELLKAIKGSKNPKAKSLAGKVKAAQGLAKKFTDIVGVKGGHSGGALGRNEGKLNEDAIATFNKELNGEGIKAKVYTATGDGKTVEAQFTNKKWEDGVPVTKNLSRGGYKRVKTPRGKFKVIETDKFFYYEINNGWAAVSRKRYTTPPFEY